MVQLSSILTIIGIALICVVAQDHYHNTFDSVDAISILADNQRREEYYNCFLDKGPCVTKEEKYFKDIIFEAIATNCEKCTDRQREMLNQVTDWYTKNAPNRWGKLLAKVEVFKNANW